jgi:hypothetical protein
MSRYAVLGLIGFAATGALAQQSPPQGNPPSAPSAPAASEPAKATVTMEQPQPGDRWVFEVRDEIAGTVIATRTFMVTEVAPTEIAIRYTNAGNPGINQQLFDRSWNLTQSGAWKYSPNDGTGVQMPLTVGKTWSFRSSEVNASSGNIWKRSGGSKVVGQESLTVKAGTFETFKIETSYTSQSVKDPTRKSDVTEQFWYAPALNHWIKHTRVVRENKRLLTNTTLELTEYGRKQ